MAFDPGRRNTKPSESPSKHSEVIARKPLGSAPPLASEGVISTSPTGRMTAKEAYALTPPRMTAKEAAGAALQRKGARAAFDPEADRYQGMPDDDRALEAEADAVGARAAVEPVYEDLIAPSRTTKPLRPDAAGTPAPVQAKRTAGLGASAGPSPGPIIQCMLPEDEGKGKKRARYEPGMHGAKRKEQKRLHETYNIQVTGSTHESEHTIGFEPLAQTSGEKRGKSERVRELENKAYAYQEAKELHRAHPGTGTRAATDPSGFTSAGYRNAQRSLLEVGDVSSAVQINQLGYAFNPAFSDVAETPAGQAATDSYFNMIRNMKNVSYAQGPSDATVEVTPEARAEMALARFVAINRRYPTLEEEAKIREDYGA